MNNKPIGNKLLEQFTMVNEGIVDFLIQFQMPYRDKLSVIVLKQQEIINKLEKQVIATMQKEINDCKEHSALYYHTEDRHEDDGWYGVEMPQDDDVKLCKHEDCLTHLDDRNKYYQPEKGEE